MVMMGNIRKSLRCQRRSKGKYRPDSHSSSNSAIQGLSLAFGHDPKQGVSVEDSLRRIRVFMLDELVFENRDLTLVFDVEVSGLDVSGHG